MTSHEFVDADLSGALFREVDLTGARMYGVVLSNADIDGAIDGLRVNGVEVAPLIEAELDRLHPERLALRPTTPDELRTASTSSTSASDGCAVESRPNDPSSGMKLAGNPMGWKASGSPSTAALNQPSTTKMM